MIHKFEEGGIWEEKNFDISTNHVLSENSNECRHVKDGILRAVVIAANEGGYNTTGVCLDCILEASKTIK